MDTGQPKSLNSEDKNSCQISIYDDDDRVGLIDYCLPPRTSNGTAASSDNYSSSKNMSSCSKGSPWNDSVSLESYAKAQFERQVAQKDAIDRCQRIEKYKHLCGFGGNECDEVLNSENASELEKTGAKEAVLGSFFQADEFNELVHKNNSKLFDEEVSCESEDQEQEHDVEESCCDAENECRAEYNSMVHERNTEQFDEVLSVDSDEDLVKNTGLPKSSYCAVDETVVELLNSEPKELSDSDFKVKAFESKVKTNGYDAASHRKAYSSKYSGTTSLRSVDRCSNLLSSCGYPGSQSSTIDSEKKREQHRPFVGSDQDSEIDVTCGVGNYQSIQSDDSDDSEKFCERSSELDIQHQPFFSHQDDLRSERGTGDWLFRGNSLHAASSLRGYPTPQYHLTRYGFSSELEQSSLLTNRYYQLRLRRHAKRERQDAAVVNSTDVPGYKGNLDVEELLSYINDSKGLGHRSENHGGIDGSTSRPAEKAGKKRKKGGSKGTEKPDRVESSSKSTDKRTGDAKVDLAIKTNERVRVKNVSKLNRANTVSDDEKDVSDISREQKIGNDLMSQRIGDSSLAVQETCDIPQGNVDSIKTVTVDRPLDKSLTLSSSSPVLRSTRNDVSLQRAASTEDDFTMVTKKKKSKKNNSKRAKLPRSDCLPVSSDSVALTNAVHDFVSPLPTASKESTINHYQTKSRNSSLSKFSNAVKPSVEKTVTQDSGLYLEAHGEKTGNEVQKKPAKVYGKAVDVHAVMTVQSTLTGAPGIGESKTYDSAAGKSTSRHLSSHGKPTLQNREKQESRKSLTGAENLLVPLQVTARASLESGVKQVAAEKHRNSKRPPTEHPKDLSVEKLEMSPSGKQQNLSQANVAKPRRLSQDEKVKPQKLSQDEEVISQKLSQDEKVISENMSQDRIVKPLKLSQNEEVISGNLSQDEKVISENLSQDRIVKPHNLSQNEEVIFQELSQDDKVISGNLSRGEKVVSENLSQDRIVKPRNLSQNEEFISQELSQDEKVISGNLSQDEKVISENLFQDRIVNPQNLLQNEEAISQKLVEDETDFSGHLSQKLPENDVALPENLSQYGIEMSEKLGQDEMTISQMPGQDEVRTFQMLMPVEQSLPQKDSLHDALLSAQAASDREAFGSYVPPWEQPVVFLDRQRRLFSVPAKKDLGLKFGHFDDCDSAPDESRTPPFPGPINFFHYIPVPYNHEDGPEKPITDSNSMMFPIAHQYMPQLMYPNGPLCKPAFQVYPNGHIFPVPMQFAPFVPPGFCVVPHTTNVPVGVVSPTMNNRTREETSGESTDSNLNVTDGSDSCVASFAAMQSIAVPTEPAVQPHLQPEPAQAVMASISLSSSGRCKSVFNTRAAVHYLYSEWLHVIREERGPNGGVVRYNPELDL